MKSWLLVFYQGCCDQLRISILFYITLGGIRSSRLSNSSRSSLSRGWFFLQNLASRSLVDDVLRKVNGLKPIADELGVPLAQLAIAWCALNPNVSSVITGATKESQVWSSLTNLSNFSVIFYIVLFIYHWKNFGGPNVDHREYEGDRCDSPPDTRCDWEDRDSCPEQAKACRFLQVSSRFEEARVSLARQEQKRDSVSLAIYEFLFDVSMVYASDTLFHFPSPILFGFLSWRTDHLLCWNTIWKAHQVYFHLQKIYFGQSLAPVPCQSSLPSPFTFVCAWERVEEVSLRYPKGLEIKEYSASPMDLDGV